MVVRRLLLSVAFAVTALMTLPSSAGAENGYYRQPSLAGDTVYFLSEGDFWSVPVAGGSATRLTSNVAQKGGVVTSPDGKYVAFAATYDGPAEVYVMPVAGGEPKRVSFEGANSLPVGWTPSGEVLYITQNPTGPATQFIVIAVDPVQLHRRTLPLADVSDAAVSADGRTLYFTRFGLGISADNVQAYRGGLLSRLWQFDIEGGKEAQPVIPIASEKDRFNDRRPMVWNNRLYFISDRDGHDNLWTVLPNGSDLKQLTHATDFNIRTAKLDHGRIVYQLGADLHVYDIAAQSERKLTIDIASDFDQKRPHLIKRPLKYLEKTAFASNGKRVATVVRGHVVLMGLGPLRRIDIAAPATARASDGQLSPDGKWLYTILDQGGSPQIWRFAADGSADQKQLTSDDAGQRHGLWLSPDGKTLVNGTLDGRLFLLNVDTGENRLIDKSEDGELSYVTWSPDNQYLAFARSGSNATNRSQIFLFEPASNRKEHLTSDRYISGAPAFTPDGKWLYFLSERAFKSSNHGPWGDRNMGPYFDKRTKVYALALQTKERFPFYSADELTPTPASKKPTKKDDKSDGTAKKDEKSETDAAATDAPAATDDKSTPEKPAKLPAIEWTGLADRLYEVPLAAGNYSALETDGKQLYFLETGAERCGVLKTLKIDDQEEKPQDLFTEVCQFALSADRKKMFIRKGTSHEQSGDMLIVNTGTKMADVTGTKFQVRAGDWALTVDPKAEWRQLYDNAWRLHRDYFYDKDMHGLDWGKIHEKYLPLVERVADRNELNDVLAQMMGELGTMHSQITPGDVRTLEDGSKPGFLGAVLTTEPGGARITHIYKTDMELPDERGPLAQSGLDVHEGDLITAVNGRKVSDVHDIAELLINQAGEQVLLTLQRKTKQPSPTDAKDIKVVVKAVDATKNARLRYSDWEEGRRAVVEAAGGGRIGYLHLRAMGADDIATFAREFYTQADREALIIDVRRNNGGNIDSWILEKLLRRAWAYWKPRYGTHHEETMQKSFRGHLAVLIDERTYSDGEAFAAGIKALKLGPLIGMRTSGAGIWLDDSTTRLSDQGNARTAEFPLFAIGTGELLVENKGVEPDIVVENLPYATFAGHDAQLDTAVRVLLEKMKAEPVPKL